MQADSVQITIPVPVAQAKPCAGDGARVLLVLDAVRGARLTWPPGILLAALLACHQDTVTETNRTRLSTASKEPITVQCAPEPRWERIASRVVADSTRTGRIRVEGMLFDSACELRMELRDAAAVPLLGVTLPATHGTTATSSSSDTTEGPIGTLDLWVAAIGPPGASATYSYKVETVESKTKSR